MNTAKTLVAAIAIVFLAACGSPPPSGSAVKGESGDRAADPPTAAAASGDWGAAIGEPGSRDHDPIFPKSPPPSHLYVYDVQAESADMRLLLATLQGVIAQTDPRLYLLYNSDVDPFWLQEMADHDGVTYETASDPWALVDQFAAELTGYIVYDPDLPGTINVATTMAGVEQAVVAAPALVATLEAHGLTAVADLRGQFADDVALVDWAMANVWPDANHTIFCFLDPSLPMLRDYLAAHRIMTIMLDPHVPAERAKLEEVLATTPQNIPLLGWAIDELLGVILFSQGGKFHVASDWARNMSVSSGLPFPALTQDHAAPVENIEPKTYIGFAVTDGDNVAYSLDALWRQWNDPARGAVPLGWVVSFNLVDLAPEAIRYYYETRSDLDMFIGPPSGIGYMYPSQYPDLPGFLELTQPYMQAADMDTLWLINDDLTLPDPIVVAYQEALDLAGIYIDYWPNMDKGFYFASDGTPVLRSQYVYLVGPEQIPDIIAEKRIEKDAFYPDSPFFLFIGVNGWTTGPTAIKEIVDGLDDSYIVQRPDEMFAAMRRCGELGYEF